jgi:tetrahydromethanopterin S-methyltransferase subunit H
MYRFKTEQKVCEVGGVKFGGQPGQYATVVIPSIFQKGDKVFEGARKEGFDEKRAAELLKSADKLSKETGVPCMVDLVGTKGEEFKRYVDFLVSVTDMPFCVDAWVMKPKLEGAKYCAEKGLLDRMFYNSITVWEKDVETEIREIYQMGVKHVLLVAFDAADQMPSGRITGTQKLMDMIEKVGAKFESIFVDTSVMNGPATALCSLANKLIKDKWGFPCCSAPSNGSYMWKAAREMWGQKGWSGVDAAIEALASTMYHDLIFSGPMAGSERIFPAVAMADAFTATLAYGETKELPASDTHPLMKLFPEFVEQLRGMNA